ncbi:long-chain fatty acid--CoA ligase [Virgisporangium ochraceum]|uniref:Long-chain-fatty-acid--CoA ligase n=1 Tax=Virgisporangium ochraceum TaxID=65505 RepID=A0A8J4EE58_9ACTN|nr:long-chain fatty acid--CoA ligase [Virgisporangium ochraceum]GIJ71278.1 long-chain-fatty-acid--CoA ligase [Virgisporangium ochraceum]
MFNVAVILRESAKAWPDKPVAVHSAGRMTYAELDALSDALAEGLVGIGIRPGDTVALQLPNIPQFLVAYFGILKAGAVVVPMNVLLKAREAAYCLATSGSRALITWGGMADEAGKAAAEAGVPDVFVVGTPEDGTVMTPFAELLAPTGPSRPLAAREPVDTAVVVFTSGTTGRPKGAELTHFQLYMNADVPGRLFDVRPDDVVLAALPLFHIFGLSSVLDVCVRFGCTMSLVPRFDAGVALEAIQRDGVTIFDGVPTMFIALLDHPDLDRFDTSSLRVAVSGGAAIPAHVLDAFEARFGVAILEGYGLTETAATATFNTGVDDRRAYSVGRPIWGTDTEIRDDRGNRLPPGRDHVGELVTRGFHVMKGYLNQPEATAEAFTDGWFHTGDLGYVDEDGFFFIVDRKTDLIIRGGYNVYPREVEEVLYSHPAVAQAAVVGIPHVRLGEEVKAFVALKPGESVAAEDLVAYCRDRMAAYKYPRTVEIRDGLPVTGAGKIAKLRLERT